jgi:predicted RNA-binding protein
MQDVIHFKVEGNRVWLSRLFEEPVEIKAMVVESDFLKHTVTLRSLEEES